MFAEIEERIGKRTLKVPSILSRYFSCIWEAWLGWIGHGEGFSFN